eukprot:428229-Pelagomonas_calceolata.AAC.2
MEKDNCLHVHSGSALRLSGRATSAVCTCTPASHSGLPWFAFTFLSQFLGVFQLQPWGSAAQHFFAPNVAVTGPPA